MYNKKNRIYNFFTIWKTTKVERTPVPEVIPHEEVENILDEAYPDNTNYLMQNVKYKFNIEFTLPRWATMGIMAMAIFTLLMCIL